LHQSSEPQILGTAAYMAPEQAAGLSVSPASDWYSVGAMLFEALTGRRPFLGRPLEVLMDKQNYEPPPPRALVPDVPEDLNALCVALLRRDPRARPSGAEVLQRLGAAPRDLPRLGTQRRPFVGREGQLAALGAAFAEVRRGRTVAVFVHGASGVGKSALIRRFLEGLTEGDEAVVLVGRCYEQESVAYKALDTLIDALIRYLRRLPRHEADVLMPRDLSALARVFPVLRRVAAVAEAPQRTHAIIDQQELRRRAFAALRELLARIGDRRPLVLAIDDLQWGDGDSASLLADLLRSPDPPVLLLVGAYRREDAAVSPCLQKLLEPSEEDAVLRDRREVAVAALSPSEGRALALALIGQDDEAARRLAETIARESGGSPYFVSELVQYLLDGGELGESLAALSSDVRLDEVLWRRIQRHPGEAQSLLEVLAVAGQPIRQAMACQIAGLGAEGFWLMWGIWWEATDHWGRALGLRAPNF
ncbi:MAG: AAA family ATPase, partial [Planctomycetaceae bacterium]|nr:AAA family ATPase [Planctomycetaceae bacterium]